MENNAELVRLEQFVDKLLSKYKKLQETRSILEARLEERDSECDQLKTQLAELRSERTQVGNKVAGLIDRIEQWELAADEDDVLGGEDSDDMQGELFSGESRTADQGK
ncbi:MAG: hypothetical protein SCH71_10885 [Desulfobulbaceae bacterium]|nr:hypothetical protein [Desulfobulbaceae bacterium]